MRRSSTLTITAISCVLFGAAALRIGPELFSAFAAQPQSSAAATSPAGQAAGLKPVSASAASSTIAAKTADLPTPAFTGGGSEAYVAKRGDTIPAIARQYLKKTSFLTSSELSEAIRQANGGRSANVLKSGEQISIPGILSAPINEKPIVVPRDFEVRAVYLTGVMAGSDHGLRIIRHWREVGGNAVVFDIKDSDGSVTIPFEHPLLGKHNVYIHDVPKLVHFLHTQGMHAIARIAIFRDERLVTEHPELAVKSKRTGQPWRENGKLVWTDPSQPKVQEYDIALARHVAELGVDEIQFDYVRFPAEGDQKDAGFYFQSQNPEPAQSAEAAPANNSGGDNSPCGDGLGRPANAKQGATKAQPCSATTESANSNPSATAANSQGRKSRASGKKGTESRREGTETAETKPSGPQRSDVIANFLKKAYAEIHPTGALLSLDVFGVMAWQRPVDLSHTGQDIVAMAKYCDVLSPMVYPSHFFGMDNIAHPGDAPEHFIGESMDRFMLITRGSGVVIRPWLQAFHWRTKTYSPEYVEIQVRVAKEKGGVGFLFWNAANDYSKPFVAMPEMKAANHKDGASKDNPKYFRGDELPTATAVRAALVPAK